MFTEQQLLHSSSEVKNRISTRVNSTNSDQQRTSFAGCKMFLDSITNERLYYRDEEKCKERIQPKINRNNTRSLQKPLTVEFHVDRSLNLFYNWVDDIMSIYRQGLPISDNRIVIVVIVVNGSIIELRVALKAVVDVKAYKSVHASIMPIVGQ